MATTAHQAGPAFGGGVPPLPAAAPWLPRVVEERRGEEEARLGGRRAAGRRGSGDGSEAGGGAESCPTSVRSSADVDVRLALKLDVVAGPCAESSYTTGGEVCEATVGRGEGNALVLAADTEVSGQHVSVRWDSFDKCWQV